MLSLALMMLYLNLELVSYKKHLYYYIFYLIIINIEGPKPVNCNFEDTTICSWAQFNYDDLDWLPTRGRKGKILNISIIS
jgi:hypothetical protein